MASVDIAALEAAYADGFFESPLSEGEKIYLKQTISTAWRIITAVNARRDIGIGVDRLAEEAGIHPNTVKIYCRWLRQKSLILAEFEAEPGAPIVFYAVDLA